MSVSELKDELSKLITNASTYMQGIDAFALKTSAASVHSILDCLFAARSQLDDKHIPLIKKLLVLRFVKDTLLLGSLAFWDCAVIRILPWLVAICKEIENKPPQDKGRLAGRWLCGGREVIGGDLAVCKMIIDLSEEVVRWFGTNCPHHPYSKIQFKSAFRVVLDRTPSLRLALQDMKFFKPDDPNKFQDNLMERQSQQSESERLNEYVSWCLDKEEQGQRIPQLYLLLETGDSCLIAALVQELQSRLGELSANGESSLRLAQLVGRCLMVGEVEFVNSAKRSVLQRLMLLAALLYNQSKSNKWSQVLGILGTWETKCSQLLIPTEAFNQVYNYLRNHQVPTNIKGQTLAPYSPLLNQTNQINADKLSQLDCNELSSIARIRSSKNLPPNSKMSNESNNNKAKKQASKHSNKSSSNSIKRQPDDESRVSIYKAPSPASEMKGIIPQHSNLSENFRSTLSKQVTEMPFKPFRKSNKEAEEGKLPIVLQQSEESHGFKVIEEKQEERMGSIIDSLKSPSNHSHSRIKPEVPPQPSLQIRTVLNTNTLTSHPSFSNPTNPSNREPEPQPEPEPQQPNIYTYRASPTNSINERYSNHNDYVLPQTHQRQDSSRSRSSRRSQLRKEKSSSIIRKSSSRRGRSRQNSQSPSPISTLSRHKSINILRFNETQKHVTQQYTPIKNASKPAKPEPIIVEATVRKPKFAFKDNRRMPLEISEVVLHKMQPSVSQQSSISVTQGSLFDPSVVNSSAPLDAPDNFADILQVKRGETVRVNEFEHNKSELQAKISKLKAQKEQAIKDVRQKDQAIARMKREMPPHLSAIEAENKQLKLSMRPTKQRTVKKQSLPNGEIYKMKADMTPVVANPLKEDLKKQLLYKKCRLYKGDNLEIGFQVRQQDISLYFTFNKRTRECRIKVDQRSLILVEDIDAHLYEVNEGKQLKFKSRIRDYKLFGREFDVARLNVKLKGSSQSPTVLQLPLPYHLYSTLSFMPPKDQPSLNRTTDWHLLSSDFEGDLNSMSDYLPLAKRTPYGLLTRIESKGQPSHFAIVVQHKRILVQFPGVDEQIQLPIVKCLLAIFASS